MRAHGDDVAAMATEPAIELNRVCEQRELASRVRREFFVVGLPPVELVHTQLTEAMGQASDADDSGARRVSKERQEHAGEREGAEVVRREMQLLTRFVSRQRHAEDACVVNQQIET